MKINIDVFNLYDRACKVYRNICASETVKYILVQGVDKAWLGKETVLEEVSPAHGQGVDKAWLSNAEYGHEMPPLAAEAVKILEKAEAGIVFANFGVENWNDDLSPWSVDAVI